MKLGWEREEDLSKKKKVDKRKGDERKCGNEGELETERRDG